MISPAGLAGSRVGGEATDRLARLADRRRLGVDRKVRVRRERGLGNGVLSLVDLGDDPK